MDKVLLIRGNYLLSIQGTFCSPSLQGKVDTESYVPFSLCIFLYKCALFIPGCSCFYSSDYNIIDSTQMQIMDIIIDSWRVSNTRKSPMGKMS